MSRGLIPLWLLPLLLMALIALAVWAVQFAPQEEPETAVADNPPVVSEAPVLTEEDVTTLPIEEITSEVTEEVIGEAPEEVTAEPTDEPTEEPTPLPTGEAANIIALARWILAQQLKITVDEVELISVEAVEWPDACLGIYTAGVTCAQVITPGYLVILAVNGQQYEYHTDSNGYTVLLLLEPYWQDLE